MEATGEAAHQLRAYDGGSLSRAAPKTQPMTLADTGAVADREARKPVLIVEDDPDLLAMMEIVLDSADYPVRRAFNGQEALQVTREQMPGLILLDMKMPVMDGKEFARRFHAQFGDGSPIVILTASADGRQRADEVGARDWVAKPFDLDVLVDSVRKNIRNGDSSSD